MSEDKPRLYAVKCWIAPTEPRKWGHHQTYGVIASNAREAMERIEKEHPDARIDAVNVQWRVDYMPEE